MERGSGAADNRELARQFSQHRRTCGIEQSGFSGDGIDHAGGEHGREQRNGQWHSELPKSGHKRERLSVYGERIDLWADQRQSGFAANHRSVRIDHRTDWRAVRVEWGYGSESGLFQLRDGWICFAGSRAVVLSGDKRVSGEHGQHTYGGRLREPVPGSGDDAGYAERLPGADYADSVTTHFCGASGRHDAAGDDDAGQHIRRRAEWTDAGVCECSVERDEFYGDGHVRSGRDSFAAGRAIQHGIGRIVRDYGYVYADVHRATMRVGDAHSYDSG